MAFHTTNKRNQFCCQIDFHVSRQIFSGPMAHRWDAVPPSSAGRLPSVLINLKSKSISVASLTTQFPHLGILVEIFGSGCDDKDYAMLLYDWLLGHTLQIQHSRCMSEWRKQGKSWGRRLQGPSFDFFKSLRGYSLGSGIIKGKLEHFKVQWSKQKSDFKLTTLLENLG